MNYGLAIKGSTDLLEKLKLVYDFEDLPPNIELAKEMLGCLKLRAGIPMEKLSDKTAESIIPLPPNLEESLFEWLNTNFSVGHLNLLCATMDTGKSIGFYTEETELIKELCSIATIEVEGFNAKVIVEDGNGNLLSEIIEAMDADSLFEGICECIDFYKVLPRYGYDMTKH